MADFDQGRAILNAGSGRIPEAKKKIVPLKPDYVPKAGDDDIVKEAYELKQKALRHQVDKVQTKGRQKGFTKASVDGVLKEQL